MLCCTADGHKLDPYLIFNRKTLPANVAFPANVIVRVHPKGWMDTDLMVDWIDSVWRKRPGADLAVRSMLVLDSFRCHITQRVKDKLAVCRTDLVVIPGEMTSQLQPLEVCLNKPIKDRVRAAYNEWLIDGEHALTPAGRLKRAALNDLAKTENYSFLLALVFIKKIKEIDISGTPQLNIEVAPSSTVTSFGVVLVSGWVLLASVSPAFAALPPSRRFPTNMAAWVDGLSDVERKTLAYSKSVGLVAYASTPPKRHREQQFSPEDSTAPPHPSADPDGWRLSSTAPT
ncbi:pogo transposable element with KRAB domain [Ixodes scapularis]